MTIRWPRRIALALGSGIIGLTLAGGCATKHLHDQTGRAYHAIIYQQIKKGRRAPLATAEMATGEEVEVVMENFEKMTKYSELKQQGGMGLLPLQR
jgi:hypothetical protein